MSCVAGNAAIAAVLAVLLFAGKKCAPIRIDKIHGFPRQPVPPMAAEVV